jgi:hypothetical protein
MKINLFSDLGVQIDGYMAAVASTVALSQEKITVDSIIIILKVCSQQVLFN